MRNYQDAYRDFAVRQLASEVLAGSLTDGMNAAIECCDRLVGANRPALNWISKDFTEEKIVTFEHCATTPAASRIGFARAASDEAMSSRAFFLVSRNF